MKKCCAGIFLVILISLASFAAAEVRLPAVISDNMILQQKARVPLWGWAAPDEEVSVRASWEWLNTETTADKNGKWQVFVATPEAGGPHRIDIKARNSIALTNVYVGEVWVCSGQSNMEFKVRQCIDKDPRLDTERDILGADFPKLRFFTVKKNIAATPQDDCEGEWIACTPESVKDFSAVGYFFARELQQKLDVPVGMIHTSWGGTAAQAWTSADALKTMPDFAEAVERLPEMKTIDAEYQEQMTEWRKSIQSTDAGKPGASDGWSAPDTKTDQWKPMTLPRMWVGTDLAGLDGVVWFRKTVEIPDAWVKKDLLLSLGPIDDNSIVWVNGQKVGETNGWDVPRVHSVPASILKAGENSIVVRVEDTSGEGGFSGTPEQMALLPQGDSTSNAISLTGEWLWRVGYDAKTLTPQPRPNGPILTANTPTALYNAMLAPIIPYGIQGAIWYQGESNVSRPEQYQTLFPLMIQDWRTQWNKGNFAFGFVQIAPFNYGQPKMAARLREAQAMALKLPNTGMAVTMDLGNPTDIHPLKKTDVGERLARWALAKTYGKTDIAYSGPVYKSMTVEGNKARLSFDFADSGLVARGGALTHFVIAGEDKLFVEAKARIDGKDVVVWSDQVAKPLAVRYGWDNADEPNLFNKDNLPASLFRTDNWPTSVIPVPKFDDWWQKRHADKLARIAKGDVDLLFIGDSITHNWEVERFQPIWEKYYGQRKAVNLGYSGDRTENVIWRLLNGEIDGIAPKVAVLMIGTNNTDGVHFPIAHTGEEVYEGISVICQVLRKKLPDTKILILSVFPFGEEPNPRRTANEKASELAAGLADGKHIYYLDISRAFLNSDATISADVMPDFLHPSPKGQEIWARAMEPKLAELLEEK